MKNILNNIFGISKRCKGTVDKNGYVKVDEILSYDIVSDPPFDSASFSDINEIQNKILKELERQQLLKSRREKINRLNNLQD